MKPTTLRCVVMGLALAGSGCLSSRVIVGMGQAGDKNVTLVQTSDVYSFAYAFPVRVVHQFWKCSEAPGTLSCAKSCDTKGSDLTCPAAVGGVGSNIRSGVQ